MSYKDIMAQMAMTAEEMKEMSIRQAAGMRNAREDELSRFGTGLQNAYKPALAKHTPGPWNYGGFADHCEVGRAYHEITDADGFEIINQNGIVTNEGDARLIAAAPELLDALYGIETLYAEMSSALPSMVNKPGIDLVTEAVTKARAAIAKATVE